MLGFFKVIGSIVSFFVTLFTSIFSFAVTIIDFFSGMVDFVSAGIGWSMGGIMSLSAANSLLLSLFVLVQLFIAVTIIKSVI